MTVEISQRGKEYLKTAQTLLRTAKTMTDQAIAAQLKALADDYERRAEQGFARRCSQGIGSIRRALNTSGIHELMGSFPRQLSGRPDIERQPKVDPSVGGERAVSARVSFGVPGAHPSKKGAVQVPGLGLEMRGLPDLQTKMQADFRDLFRVAAMSDATSTVLVIDDDPDLRASVGRLLRSLGIERSAICLHFRLPQIRSTGLPHLPGARYQIARPKRPRFPARASCGKQGDPDHLRHGPRRHTDVCAGNETGCDRVPDQAVPRPGSSRCHSAWFGPRSCAAGE